MKSCEKVNGGTFFLLTMCRIDDTFSHTRPLEFDVAPAKHRSQATRKATTLLNFDIVYIDKILFIEHQLGDVVQSFHFKSKSDRCSIFTNGETGDLLVTFLFVNGFL